MSFKNLLSLTLSILLSSTYIISFSQQEAAAPTGGFKLFFEKVYLHLDRNYYASGDDIWFKAYLVNAQTNKLFNTSNNLYVELIPPGEKISSRIVIRMDNGTGVGDFKLPDSLANGTYRIRAYTNWMRNFGNHFIYEKEIQVRNIVKNGNNSITKAGRTTEGDKKTPSTNTYKIQFLPEGGSLVEGLNTIVAFKAEDANGVAVEAKGSIISSKGDTAARFKTSYLGMGTFNFKPLAGLNYRALVQYNNRPSITAAFPAVLPEGFVMNVTGNDTAKVSITIHANAAAIAKHPTGEITIAARHAGKSYFKEKFFLKEGSVAINIPKNDFPEGIAAVTLYDEAQHPYCERLVFIENNHPSNVSITTYKATYAAKEKVTVNIAVTDADQQPLKSALSMAVVDDNLDKSSKENILSYLLLQSDLQGKIENAAAYFDKNNNERLQQLDLLLRTQGWRDFLWRQLADTSVRISYLPEPGITVSGRVREKFANKPIPDMNITFYAPAAKGNKWYMTRTNSTGKYFLDGLPLYGTQTIKINSKNDKAKKGGLLLMDTLFSNPLPVSPSVGLITDTSAALRKFEQESSKRFSALKNTGWVNILPNVTVTSKSRAIVLRDGSGYVSFGYPEYSFSITSKDFQYPTLKDFLVQKVPGAMYDEEMQGVNFLSNGKRVRPRVIVDKKEDVFERLDYYSISMSQVTSVTVRHLVGQPTFDRSDSNERINSGTGIRDMFVINLELKPGAYNNDVGLINTEITGYYEGRIFYAPNYPEYADKTKPDMRTTIFWEPLITTDENGKATISFYNADPATNIRVDVQGVTDKGSPVVAGTRYQVK